MLNSYTYRILLAFLFTLVVGCEKQKHEVKEEDPYEEIMRNVERNFQRQLDCFENIDNYIPPEGYTHIKEAIYKRAADTTYHFLTCSYDGLAYFNQLYKDIDIETLERHGEFWTDKNQVYREYGTSDGILFFRLDSVDRETFFHFPILFMQRIKIMYLTQGMELLAQM